MKMSKYLCSICNSSIVQDVIFVANLFKVSQTHNKDYNESEIIAEYDSLIVHRNICTVHLPASPSSA